MALKTKVPVMYRTPYIPKTKLPEEVNRIMRQEITEMRKNLLKKQQRLREHPDFSDNAELTAQLKDIKVRALKNDKQVQTQWARLRGLQKSNKTSITGHRITAQRTVDTLREQGLVGIDVGNVAAWGEFIQWVKDTYGKNAYSSRDVKEYLIETGDEISVDELQAGYEEWLEGG